MLSINLCLSIENLESFLSPTFNPTEARRRGGDMVSFSLLLPSSKRSHRNCGSYEEGGIFFSISSNQSVAGITGARVGWGEGYSSPPNIILTQMLLAQARIQAPVFPHNLHAHTRFALDFYALTRSHKSTSTRTHARVFHACSTSAHAHARDFHARARFPLVFHARVHAHTRARTRARMSQIVFRIFRTPANR